jgi:hypothetical protein
VRIIVELAGRTQIRYSHKDIWLPAMDILIIDQNPVPSSVHPTPHPESRQKQHHLRYVNVMEYWVQLEVYQQLRKLRRINRYIEPSEIVTYALNRLPPLYASCEEGKTYQLEKGKLHRAEIRTTVLDAIKHVLRDPIRKSTPLVPEEISEILSMSLVN